MSSLYTITALEAQKRRVGRVNLFLDDEFAFSLSLDDAALLRKGQTLTEAEVEALRAQDDVGRAVERGVRQLSVRPRSEHEIRTALAEKETPPAAIEMAITRLYALGYLDDRAFAEFWVRERQRSKPLGVRALRYELKRKGIANDLIDETLADMDAEDAAYRAVEPLIRRLRGSDVRTFKTRIAQLLARRGFNYDIVRTATRQWMETLEESDPAYFAQSGTDDDEPLE